MAAPAIARGVKAVIFDWAGTIVDYGSIAPVQAFIATFKKFGVDVDIATARAPMGMNKRDHIAAIFANPGVAAAWSKQHGGGAPDDAAVDAVYAAFTPVQLATVVARAEPIPGAVATLAALRRRGIRIGSCSGYHGAIMDALIPAAAAKGLTVDAYACANAAGTNGRPKPWLSTTVAEALDVYPLSSIVKVDDTLPGIAEGLNAGMITVGVALSGNEVGLDAHEVAAAAGTAELDAKLAKAYARFYEAGAHYVIDTVAELPAIIRHIEARGPAAPPLR